MESHSTPRGRGRLWCLCTQPGIYLATLCAPKLFCLESSRSPQKESCSTSMQPPLQAQEAAPYPGRVFSGFVLHQLRTTMILIEFCILLTVVMVSAAPPDKNPLRDAHGPASTPGPKLLSSRGWLRTHGF